VERFEALFENRGRVQRDGEVKKGESRTAFARIASKVLPCGRAESVSATSLGRNEREEQGASREWMEGSKLELRRFSSNSAR